jgi:DNA-binding NarL/FixJ family response regulator
MSTRSGFGEGHKIRVLFVDEHPIVRDALEALVDRRGDVELVGRSSDVESALDAVGRTTPDVVVSELRLPGPGGFGLLRELRSRHDGVRFVVLTDLDQATYVQRALEAGADGFVSKADSTDTLFQAIRTVHDGETFLSERLAKSSSNVDLERAANGSEDPLSRLSNRELEVFRLIGEGRGTREIAELLDRSIKTVEAHREHIKQKLALRDGSALLQRAIQWVWEENRNRTRRRAS